jgi:Family of unknown function (DUF6499)
MSEFDWRSAEAYTNLRGADAADFAWEFLRRSGDYREDYRLVQSGGLPDLIAKFRQRWGLSFRG